MPKLAKNYYYGKNGEKKLNCYILHISKEILNKTDIKDTDTVNIIAKDGKIIIEKA